MKHGVCVNTLFLTNTHYYLGVEFLAASSDDSFQKGILWKLCSKRFLFTRESQGSLLLIAQFQTFKK